MITAVGWLLLLAAGWLAATVSGAAGFGGALLLLPVLAYVVGAKAAVPALTLAQLLGNLSRAGFGWRDILWRPGLAFSLDAVPAIVVGSRLFVSLPPGVVQRLIGVFLLAVVALRHTPMGGRRMTGILLAPACLVVGFLSGIAGSAGPLGAVVFLNLQPRRQGRRVRQPRGWRVDHPSEWDRRDLPAPAVRSVSAAVEAAAFGARCVAEATRMGLTDPTELNVLGDGAGWVWNLAERRFRGASQWLDFWHGSGHLGGGAKAVYGSGAEAETEPDRGPMRLLEGGNGGVGQWVGGQAVRMPAGGDGAALGAMPNDFAGHQTRVNSVLRMRRGQSIGSGLVGGSIKQLLNLRLRQTGARWTVEHVAPRVELGAFAAGPEWEAFSKEN